MKQPRDLAGRMRDAGDGFKRETFTLPRDHARVYARAYLDKFPAAAYSSKVESWREQRGMQSLSSSQSRTFRGLIETHVLPQIKNGLRWAAMPF